MSNPTFTLFKTDDPNKTQTQATQMNYNSDQYKKWKDLIDSVVDNSSLIRRVVSGTERIQNWILLMPTDSAVQIALPESIITYLKSPAGEYDLVTLLNFHIIRNDSTLQSTVDDIVFRGPGEAAVNDTLPGAYPQRLDCSIAEESASKCQLRVMPLNTVMIPQQISTQLQALYSLQDNVPKRLTQNKQINIPKWLHKKSYNNNIY